MRSPSTQPILKEYGANVQKLVDYIITIEDRDRRNKYAHTLVELMRQIHPGMRDAQDYSNKLWDDLYIISGFNLDVDSPYPLPEKDLLGKKPKPVGYNTHNLKYKHYGRNVELLIEKAIQIDNEDEKFVAIVYIGRLMKTFYGTWNKENVEDAVILEHLREMSGNQLSLPLERVRAESLFDGSPRERSSPVSNNPGRNPNVGSVGNAVRRNNNVPGNVNRRMPDNKRKNKPPQ
ncbi:MAG: DUF4290 domain-containing protein [Ferruginibacter sp.]|nr:DUF4290 domain-containing protein [Cytophagales bacterium]